MKRILAVLVGLVAVLLGSLWMGTRRQPAGSLLDEPVPPFAVAEAAPGWRVGYVDAQVPLRALRWLPPRQHGYLVAQAQTQNDRQQLAIFKDGALASAFPVGRPQGVGEGFWRFALLQDAYVAPTGMVVLLYKAADPASTEPALAMALQPGEVEPRWVHRGNYGRMAVGGTAELAVFLYGPKGPVQRLPLASPSRRPVAKDLPLPPELPEVDDLLPTGAWTFLVSRPDGLSAFLGTKGWVHYPAPEGHAVPCAGWRSSLAQSGRRIWWQPAPGQLVQVGQDGALVADKEITGFAPEDPFARDAALLRLLGADAAGRLWFGLAVPAPQPAPAEGAPAPEDWAGYAAQGLDRVYRWNPDQGKLERFQWSTAWTALKQPQGVPPGAPELHPAAGTLLLEGDRAGWWLPLDALPFGPCGGSATVRP